MKRLWGWLRTLNAGEWIAFAVIAGGLLLVAIAATSDVRGRLPGANFTKIKINTVNLDLVAQQEMATAAWVMVWFAGVSSVVGAFGLFLIFRTLQETARSADAALLSVQTAQAAMKPFITVEYANVVLDSDGFVRVNYRVRNSGSSPAYQVAFTAALTVKSLAESGQSFTEANTKSRSDIEAGGTKLAIASFRRDSAAAVSNDVGDFALYVRIDVLFQNVFGHRERISVTYGRYMNYFAMREELSLYRDVENIGWGD